MILHLREERDEIASEFAYLTVKESRTVILNLEAKWRAWLSPSSVENFTPTSQRRLHANEITDSELRDQQDYYSEYGSEMRWVLIGVPIFKLHESVKKTIAASSNPVEVMVEFPYKHLNRSDPQS